MPAFSSGVVTTSTLTNHLESRWSPRMLLDTSEEMLIANQFMTGSDLQVDKIGNTLYVRKVASKTTNSGGTGQLDIANLTFEQDSEASVTVQPSFAYTAMAVTEQVKQRLLAYPAYERAVRTQFLRSMSEYIDAQAGGLGSNLSQYVADTSLNAPLIRQALGLLRTNAQREYRTGKVGNAILRLHPSQQQHLYAIPEITNAELRGDAANPNVTGLLVKAWGCDVDISANIESDTGNRQNMLFIKQAYCLVYNQEPTLEPVQRNGLVDIIIGFCDFGVQELYDAYGVSIRTVA